MKGIYLELFPNGKGYVGQTTQEFGVRLGQHQSTKSDTLISRAFNKYSEDIREKCLNVLRNLAKIYLLMFNSMKEICILYKYLILQENNFLIKLLLKKNVEK